MRKVTVLSFLKQYTFLYIKEGESLITLNHLLSKILGSPVKDKLTSLPSDKKRIEYIVDVTKEFTGLDYFGQYLCLLFEIDSLFLNDDRHLNNIAVLEENGKYEYCPVFDNGTRLLSDTQMLPMDIDPRALISTIKARPFLASFTHQMNTARTLYGKQLSLPSFSKKYIENKLSDLIEYYPQRDRNIICRRVTECILIRQKSGKF